MPKKIRAKSKSIKRSRGKMVRAKRPAKALPSRTAKKVFMSSSRYPRHPLNPFRPGLYALIIDVLASSKDGMTRQELIKRVSEESGQDPRLCAYGVSVVCSATDSNTGPRHKSCREGFYVEKQCDHLTLHIGDA